MVFVYVVSLHLTICELFDNIAYFYPFLIDFWPISHRCTMPILSRQQTRLYQPCVRPKCMVSIQGTLWLMERDLEVLSFEDRSFDPSWKINKWRGDNLSAIAAIVFSTWCHCSHCKQFQEILASRIILEHSGLDCVRLLIPPNKDWILTSRRKHLEILFIVSLDLNIKKLNFILKK